MPNLKIGPAFDTTTILKDASGNTLKVPGGFKVAADSAVNVADGVVIESNDSDKNQFVWIPVTNRNDYKRNLSYNNLGTDLGPKDDTNYLPSGVSSEINTVVNAGGFYFGRYETKARKDGTIYVNSSCIGQLGSSGKDSNASTAKTTAKTLFSNNWAKSALCSGIQWDLTMNFVHNKLDGLGTVYDVTVAKESRRPCNGNPLADKVCNIFSLQGTCAEITAEVGKSGAIIARGGSHIYGYYSAVRRYDDYRYDNKTFRTVLYVL